MSMPMDDMDEFGNGAPQPIDASSLEQGSFERLSQGQGASPAKRGTQRVQGRRAKEDVVPPMDRRLLATLVCLALVVIVVGVWSFVRVVSSTVATRTNQSGQVDAEQVPEDSAVTFGGVSYAIIERPGGYGLGERAAGRDSYVNVGDLMGTPVAPLLFEGSIVIPENLGDGTWDIVAYTVGSGWSPLKNQDGTAQAGTGTISDAEIRESTLWLVIDGETKEIALAW